MMCVFVLSMFYKTNINGFFNYQYLLCIILTPLSCTVPYFIILLCLMPDDFTCQGESAAIQWIKSQPQEKPPYAMLW